MTSPRRWWTGLNNDAKQIVFVITTIVVTALGGTAAISIAAGDPTAIIVMAGLIGAPLGVGGLIWYASRRWPS